MFLCYFFGLWVHSLFISLPFRYQYQCNWLPGKIRPRNDLLCVEWDVKPCSTQTQTIGFNFEDHNAPTYKLNTFASSFRFDNLDFLSVTDILTIDKYLAVGLFRPHFHCTCAETANSELPHWDNFHQVWTRSTTILFLTYNVRFHYTETLRHAVTFAFDPWAWTFAGSGCLYQGRINHSGATSQRKAGTLFSYA